MPDSQQVAQKQATSKPKRRPRSTPGPRRLPPYHVVLLDDNEHTYDYVIDMLRVLFGHPRSQAYLLARQVDRSGRAIVCTTHRERAELKREQIVSYGCDVRIASSRGSMRAVIEPAAG